MLTSTKGLGGNAGAHRGCTSGWKAGQSPRRRCLVAERRRSSSTEALRWSSGRLGCRARLAASLGRSTRAQRGPWFHGGEQSDGGPITCVGIFGEISACTGGRSRGSELGVVPGYGAELLRRSGVERRSGLRDGLRTLGSSAKGREGATGAHRGLVSGRDAVQGGRRRGPAVELGTVHGRRSGKESMQGIS